MGGIKFSDAGNGGGVVGAANGLSLDALNRAVLGQGIADPLNPAAVLNSREIPLPLALFFQFIRDADTKIIFGQSPGGNNGITIQQDANGTGQQQGLYLVDLGAASDTTFFLDNDAGNFRIFADTLYLNMASNFIFPKKPIRSDAYIGGTRQITDVTVNTNIGGGSGNPDSLGIYTNRGAAGAITFTLFTNLGQQFTFVNITGNPLILAAPIGTTYRNGALLKPSPGATLTSSAVGDAITVNCLVANAWTVTSVVGSWV